ncbi:uncharacterized protein TNCV_1039681 [Trichonephila clavipes]|nr:uncharacterized protein TNCV_1039681 [Trichonephila clavipes]
MASGRHSVFGGVISEPDLLTTSESEILEGFSDQGVIQVRRITIKKNTTVFPTNHLILTFNSPNLLTSIKAGYLNCKICPYIPNPLRCFKCQRLGHSQTSCCGQLTCSRCASVGHASTDCILEPKCINCSLAHSADSKLCSKWRIEKQIQEIKTSKNISYPEAPKLIVPQTSQTYTQVAKTSTAAATTQTDETITKIIVRVHYFVRGGFVGYRSRASSKASLLSSSGRRARFLGGQKGVALQLQMHVWGSGPQRKPTRFTPHRFLNFSRGVISEPDLLGTSDSEILEGFSDQGVTQCQRFGHSQTACRGQLTCSRCASVGHVSSDCTLEQKCANCSQPHSTDSKLCPKWKIEKEIQTIKPTKTYPILKPENL